MNPFIENALRRLVPVLLAALVPVLARWIGVDDATRLVADLGSLIVAIVVSTLQTRQSRQEKLTGLAMPAGSTENDVKAIVKAGQAPSVSTPKDEVPELAAGG